MIIVSITGPGLARARRQMKRSRRWADMFELRLDLIGTSVSLGGLIRSAQIPVIATCRPVWEGGDYKGGETKRLSMLESARDAGARYVDIELNAGEDTITRLASRKKGTGLIVSLHEFGTKLPDVRRVFSRMKRARADVIKFAFAATDASSNARAFEFLALARRERRNAVAIAMGEAGEASRVLYKKFGGWATYASPEEGAEAASGQVSASLLRNIYRSELLDRSTRVYGVVGHPLAQSKGIYIHNALFHRGRRNAVYCRFPVSNLRAFMASFGSILSGCSVTIPWKEEMLRYIDRLDPVARSIGAVNTVIRRRGKLVGLNTDAPGALDAIEQRLLVHGRKVLIVGAGGAGRAVAYEARRRGADISITNRTEKNGRRLARSLGAAYVASADPSEYDIVVNTTPVGMVPHAEQTPLAGARFRKGSVVFDAVYNPRMTRLLREAKRQGAVVISGTEMYLNQAAAQSRLFAGKTPERALMERVLRSVL